MGFAPVCLLALMKAGATSIALDLTEPKEQLQAIAAKTSSSIVLSSPANQKAARQLGVAEVVVLNREMLTRPTSASAPFDGLPVVNPSDLVCVVFNLNYESGAFITHRDFCSAITYKQSALGFNNNSRALELESYTSLAAWYSFLILTCGGCLCIPS
jgi:non-ribosomal peptide synthetase component F